MDLTHGSSHAPPLARTLLLSQPDHRLARLAREGHAVAFAEIVRRHRLGLVRYAAAIVPPDDAEDVVQTALAKAHAAIHNTGTDLQIRPWLYRIVRNTAFSFLRDQPRPGVELSDGLDGVPQPPELVERREQLASVVAGIALLPDSQRAAIIARELEGRSHGEIATALQITPGAARQLIHRARTALREGIGCWLPLPLLRAVFSSPDALSAGAATGTGAGIGTGGMAGLVGTAGGLKAAALIALTGGALATGNLLLGDAGRDSLAGPPETILPGSAEVTWSSETPGAASDLVGEPDPDDRGSQEADREPWSPDGDHPTGDEGPSGDGDEPGANDPSEEAPVDDGEPGDGGSDPPGPADERTPN